MTIPIPFGRSMARLPGWPGMNGRAKWSFPPSTRTNEPAHST